MIITGASSGLGEALAHIFYDCGCKLILISRRKEELQRVKNDLMNIHVVCIHGQKFFLKFIVNHLTLF